MDSPRGFTCTFILIANIYPKKNSTGKPLRIRPTSAINFLTLYSLVAPLRYSLTPCSTPDCRIPPIWKGVRLELFNPKGWLSRCSRAQHISTGRFKQGSEYGRWARWGYWRRGRKLQATTKNQWKSKSEPIIQEAMLNTSSQVMHVRIVASWKTTHVGPHKCSFSKLQIHLWKVFLPSMSVFIFVQNWNWNTTFGP